MIEPKTVMRALHDEGADLAAAKKRIAKLEGRIMDFLYAHMEAAGMRGEIGCNCAACRMFGRVVAGSKGKKR